MVPLSIIFYNIESALSLEREVSREQDNTAKDSRERESTCSLPTSKACLEAKESINLTFVPTEEVPPRRSLVFLLDIIEMKRAIFCPHIRRNRYAEKGRRH